MTGSGPPLVLALVAVGLAILVLLIMALEIWRAVRDERRRRGVISLCEWSERKKRKP